jgi:hypothetical protein
MRFCSSGSCERSARGRGSDVFLNLPPEQTRLDRLGPEELNDLLGLRNVRLARSRQEINRHVSLGRVGQELFPLLIALVACLWAAELLVANRFYKDEPKERKGTR